MELATKTQGGGGYTDDFHDYRTTFEPIERKGEQEVRVRKVTTDDPGHPPDPARLSEGRQPKEKDIADHWVNRAITDLEKLRTSITKGSIKNLGKVHQRLGKIKGRYVGFGKHITADIIPDSQQCRATDLSLQKQQTVSTDDEHLFGCNVIETDQTRLMAQHIWCLYKTLIRVEAAFRNLKTGLGTRPVYHQLAVLTGRAVSCRDLPTPGCEGSIEAQPLCSGAQNVVPLKFTIP